MIWASGAPAATKSAMSLVQSTGLQQEATGQPVALVGALAKRSAFIHPYAAVHKECRSAFQRWGAPLPGRLLGARRSRGQRMEGRRVGLA
ncbi:hypothetical protein EXIGLDRAFT_368349 [Exidia glandulosa HHB12029]|uniref:Uncharacterized protein n=1 Tax=Exidia glandulosa HHB12029 TaxID=1314781 RepID=A0A165C3L4_EXIGL|nr:hypothetical protein EXIGLDRAFT_368349 [Exidia glandulosa HHB12029]